MQQQIDLNSFIQIADVPFFIGVLSSLLLELVVTVPQLNEIWVTHGKASKQLINSLATIIVSLLVVTGSCLNIISTVQCNTQDILGFLVLAFMGNATAFTTANSAASELFKFIATRLGVIK